MKRPKSAWNLLSKSPNSKQQSSFGFDLNNPIEKEENNDDSRRQRKMSLTDFIYSLFSRKIYAEIYYAWCKDCSERPSTEGAKYFRDELIARNNKDLKNFYFRSMRVGINFLAAFGGNLPPMQVRRIDLSDNLVNDECMHNIKNLISAKQVIYLNLSSNQISSEGLKIIQHEIIESNSLKYLNLGVYKGSFRINNFSGEGGLIIARIILNNKSLETLILQENLLGEDSGTKIGIALIQNRTLKKLVISNNKIKNKGARAIIENGRELVSLDLSYNDITHEVCSDLKNLMTKSKNLKEIIWNGNDVELKGINHFVVILNKQIKLKSLCLRNTSLNFEAVKALAKGLINNECLKILDLGENNINIDSFKDICECLNKSKIKIFRCKHNSLGDECAKYFAETILSKDTTSVLNSFDFSSCKIYDQGLIYILHGLTENEKISWINLKDNFFSHEIDFVILNFLEKNTHLTHIDLTRNRFSFQCLQKVNRIIKRNRNIQNNKEPNKLLVELYSLKYENTKLNELKETLKIIENDNAKLKLNKIDLRADFELSKKEAGEKMTDLLNQIESSERLLKLRKRELAEKMKILENKKSENKVKLDELREKLDNVIKEKEDAKALTEKIKKDTENIQVDMTKTIVELNDGIDFNKKKEAEIMKEVRDLVNKVVDLENKIKDRQDEMKLNGIEIRKDEEEINKKEKKKNKEDEKNIESPKKNDKNDINEDDKKEFIRQNSKKKLSGSKKNKKNKNA